MSWLRTQRRVPPAQRPGDSFVELGLDSMSSTSLHSSLSDASGAVKGMSFGADHWTLKTEPMAGFFRMRCVKMGYWM